MARHRNRTFALVLALLGAVLVAPARAEEFVCKKLDSFETIRVKDCKPVPSATPSPKATPTPPETSQAKGKVTCPDGSFAAVEGEKRLQLVKTTFTPGREYRYCLTVPEDGAGRIVTLQTRNYANVSCGNLETELIAPGGKTVKSGGPQPGGAGRFEAGRWLVVVKLKEPCQKKNEPFDLLFSWF